MDSDDTKFFALLIGCLTAVAIVLVLAIGFGENTQQTCIRKGCSVVVQGTSYGCDCSVKHE